MIRTYNERDLDAVIAIWLEASAIAHSFIPDSYWKSKVDEMREIYIPSADTYVYADGSTGEIAGFISLADHFIAALFIAPQQQGKGFGKQLVDYAKQLHKTLTLNVYAENHRSVIFYQKQGFIIKEERVEENTKHPEYVMEYTG